MASEGTILRLEPRAVPSGGWWSRRVTLPHSPACKAGALLVCHDPNSPARTIAERGDLITMPRREVNTNRIAARLPPRTPRLIPRKWHADLVLPQARWVLETRLRKLARGVFEMERLPGIAPGSSPWRGDILLLNHSR